MLYKKLVLPAFALFLLSNIDLAQASEEGHYMMGDGEAHQGHEMEAGQHMGGNVRHNEIFEQDHGSRTKRYHGHVMLGGEGDQSDWKEEDMGQYDDGHDHMMRGGEL